MNLTTIIYEKRDGVGFVKLNRPEAKNAIDLVLREEFRELIFAIEKDPEVRAVILTGAGNCFCAGGDVKTMGGREEPLSGRNRVLRLSDTCHRFSFLQKPVIAAVNGPALGGGLGLVLACDVVLAAPSAKFGVPQVHLGLVPDMGITYLLPRVVGLTRARNMLLTGAMIDAEEAHRIGLVTQLVPPESLLEEAFKAAAGFVGASAAALSAAKSNLLLGLDQDLGSVHRTEASSQAMMFHTTEHKEAFKAFVEKRKPDSKKS